MGVLGHCLLLQCQQWNCNDEDCSCVGFQLYETVAFPHEVAVVCRQASTRASEAKLHRFKHRHAVTLLFPDATQTDLWS